jgi:hypothetical protein
MKQGEDKVLPYYTKEEPNGCPEIYSVKEKVDGKMKDVWKTQEQMDFLEAMVNDWLNPRLESIHKDGVEFTEAPVAEEKPAAKKGAKKEIEETGTVMTERGIVAENDEDSLPF